MDIQSGAIALVLLAALFGVLSVRGGLRALQSARKMTFYRLRRQREAGGWRLLVLALLLFMIAVALPVYGLPLIYQYFPPTPTITLTPTITGIPTITLTPTITLSPTLTDTPLVTDTATITPTPSLPLAVIALFQSSITPNPSTVLSELTFSTKIDADLQPIDPETVFDNPISDIFATYSYDQMVPGSQWTAVWYRNGEQVCLKTQPFGGGTGGYDYADCSSPIGGWQPGVYETQIFVGEDLKSMGRFLVEGEPPTPTASNTPTPSRVPTRTPAPSATPTVIDTPTINLETTP